jgi:hypothetical protein
MLFGARAKTTCIGGGSVSIHHNDGIGEPVRNASSVTIIPRIASTYRFSENAT